MYTIYLDLDGVVTYPGFSEEVVRPLQAEGKNVKFWTFATELWAHKRLEEVGLKDFANPKSCIVQMEIQEGVMHRVEECLEQKFEHDRGGIRSQITKALGRESYSIFSALSEIIKEQLDGDLIIQELLVSEVARDSTTTTATSHLLKNARRTMEKFGFPVEPQVLVDRVLEFKEAQLKVDSNFKYPPLLEEGHHLLVESDCSIGSFAGEPLEKPQRRSRAFETDLRVASDGRYSLIVLPEHPDIWESPGVLMSPREVVKSLKRKLNEWDGKHMVSDLGVEMGIYQEGRRGSPERE